MGLGAQEIEGWKIHCQTRGFKPDVYVHRRGPGFDFSDEIQLFQGKNTKLTLFTLYTVSDDS
jgi:hypothetical protein